MRRAPRDACDPFGATPLHNACLARRSAGREGMIKKLLNDGHSAKKKDTAGMTPLHNLCRTVGRSISELASCSSHLLQARADVNARDKCGRSPLMLLCANESTLPPMLSTLLGHRANVNARDKRGRSPLLCLCANEKVSSEMIMVLLESRADVNQQSNQLVSPLHDLCSNWSLPAAHVLLQARANVNAVSKMGTTPLHELCANIGDYQCRDGVQQVSLLLEAGADVAKLDDEGRRPCEVLCFNFFQNGDGPAGPLCPEVLDSALSPLLLQEVSQLRCKNFQAKAEWFRGVLDMLLVSSLPPYPDFDLAHLEVHRDQVLQSMCPQMEHLTPHLEEIDFDFETGQGSGLTRELFVVFSSEMANENYNLFVCTDTDPPRLSLSPRPCVNEYRNSYLQLVGKMIGFALLKEQHLPVHFAKPFLKELLDLDFSFEDLMDFDPELYRRLVQLRAYDEEGVLALGLNFSLDDSHFGKRRKVSLVLGGEEILVTKGNLEVYLRLYAQHRMKSDEKALASLKRGFHDFCPPALIQAARTFLTVEDFDQLLSGTDSIDVDDWQRHTRYDSQGTPRTKVVRWFWEVVRSMSLQQRKQLLRFATGRTCAPIGGFKLMKSEDEHIPFTIALKEQPVQAKVRSSYPTAATCSNLLQLPRYKSKAELEKYLSAAINEQMMAFSEE
ncbi:hace1 [Symbiodinium sp. CCMP2456]|nr:hace1 [Symbiodinium sp. CCMP2456]